MTCYFHYQHLKFHEFLKLTDHQIHQHTRFQVGPLSSGIFISGFFIVFVRGIFIIFYQWFFECWKVKCFYHFLSVVFECWKVKCFYHFYQWFFFVNEIWIILYQWVSDCFISETDLIVFISGFWLFYKWNCFDHFYQWFFDCFMCEIVFIIIFCISETWVI